MAQPHGPDEAAAPVRRRGKRQLPEHASDRRLLTMTTTRADEIFTPESLVDSPAAPRHLLVIAGTVLATARCPTCGGEIQTEQEIILQSLYETYGFTNVHLVSRETFLTNAQFVELSALDDWVTMEETIRHLPHVQAVAPSRDWQVLQQGPISTPTVLDVSDDYVAATAARRDFCVSGRGVRVAVLDTGVDYTHALFGGPGTASAYEDAYGEEGTKATTRDDFFPTEQVVDGIDFIGEGDIRLMSDLTPDDDPIDRPNGHGTRVSSCVVAIAPEADLLAIKVCSLDGCPESAILSGLSFAVRKGAKVINRKRASVSNNRTMQMS
jgi:subtilisin family serine protease